MTTQGHFATCECIYKLLYKCKQCRSWSDAKIRYTVCIDLSVPIFRVITITFILSRHTYKRYLRGSRSFVQELKLCCILKFLNFFFSKFTNSPDKIIKFSDIFLNSQILTNSKTEMKTNKYLILKKITSLQKLNRPD